MVGCVGNAPTLVRLDIRFTGGSRSLRGYQPRDGCGTWNAWRGSADPCWCGALTAWTPERQSHHDRGAYETPLVLPLRRLRRVRSAFMKRRYRAVRSTFPRFEKSGPPRLCTVLCSSGCYADSAPRPVAICASAQGVPACEASDFLNGRAARRNLEAGAGIEPAH